MAAESDGKIADRKMKANEVRGSDRGFCLGEGVGLKV
jgi:hypothetical protein